MNNTNQIQALVRQIQQEDILTVLTDDEQKKILSISEYYRQDLNYEFTPLKKQWSNHQCLSNTTMLSLLLDSIETLSYIKTYILYKSAIFSYNKQFNGFNVEEVIQTLKELNECVSKESELNGSHTPYQFSKISFTLEAIMTILTTYEREDLYDGI